MLSLDNVLFIDTESDPVTKQPQSLQWRYKGKSDVIVDFTKTNYEFVKKMWGESDAVLFFNAPYFRHGCSFNYVFPE